MGRYQDLSRFSVPKGLRGRSGIYVQLWWLVQATLIRLSPQPFYGWRAFWLRRFGAKAGKNLILRPSVRVTYPWKLEIGDNVWLGDRVELYNLDRITIGDNTCISQDSYICTGSHDIAALNFKYDNAPITIGNEVWIASGCFIAAGVNIGRGAVVGARSLVLSSVGEGMIVAGHPARVLRRRLESAEN